MVEPATETEAVAGTNGPGATVEPTTPETEAGRRNERTGRDGRAGDGDRGGRRNDRTGRDGRDRNHGP